MDHKQAAKLPDLHDEDAELCVHLSFQTCPVDAEMVVAAIEQQYELLRCPELYVFAPDDLHNTVFVRMFFPDGEVLAAMKRSLFASQRLLRTLKSKYGLDLDAGMSIDVERLIGEEREIYPRCDCCRPACD